MTDNTTLHIANLYTLIQREKVVCCLFVVLGKNLQNMKNPKTKLKIKILKQSLK